MVFRAVFVGWLLMLGASCLGQEGRAEPGLERLQASDEIEIAGRRVRLVLHRSTFPVYFNEPGWSGSGFMVTAVPTESVEGPTVVWAGTPPPMHIRAPSGTAERSGFWWDSETEQLWVFAAITVAFKQHAITVNRLEFDRDADDGTLMVSRRAVATESYSFEQASDLRVDSMRFVKADDGGVALVLRHQDETETTLDLTRKVRDEAVAGKFAVNERLREAVVNDLRLDPMKSVRFQCETDEVRIDGRAVRFAVHRFDGYPSWGRILPSAARFASTPQGFAVSVLSGEDRSRVKTIYRWNDYLGPFMPEWGALSHRMDVRWDEEASQVLVGRASIYENGPQHTVVYRLQLAWDKDEQTVKVTSDARLSHFQVIEHEWGSEEWLEDSIRESRIQSLAFVDGEDGRTGLKVLYADGTQTVLDVGRAQSIMQDDPAGIEFRVRVADDEVLDAAIREDIARRREAVLSDLRGNPLKSVRFVGETDELRIDGHAVRFAMHWASATEKSSFTGNWHGPGYIVSIVPAAGATEPTPVWRLRAPTTEIHIPAMVFGAFGERTAMWWDDPGQRLWVATAFTSGKGPQVIWVTCLGVRRDDATGDWSISSLSTARKSYTPAEMNAPDSDASEFGPPALIESMRFVRADDGGIDLDVVHPTGNPTVLDLPRKVEEHSSVTETQISELLVELIREDLAGRGGDGE